MNIQVPGVTESAQMMMVDLGSATLSFCDGAELDAKLAEDKVDPSQGQCVSYGSASQGSYWVGSVYKKELVLPDLHSDGDIKPVAAEFATMSQHKGMTCASDGYPMPPMLAGIVGIMNSRGNTVVTPMNDPVQTYKETNGSCPCHADWDPNACPAGMEAVKDPNAFLSFLAAEGDHTYGLAWSGSLGSHEGRIYFGGGATDSAMSPWDASTAIGPVQAIPQDSEGFQKSFGWWQLNITGVSFNGKAFPMFPVDYCTGHAGSGFCIMDTGNNYMQIPKQVCDFFGIDASAGTPGELTFTVSDWNGSGSSVELTVDASKYYNPRHFYNCDPTNQPQFVFGFAFWHFYYTVLDDVTDHIWYVPKANGVK